VLREELRNCDSLEFLFVLELVTPLGTPEGDEIPEVDIFCIVEVRFSASRINADIPRGCSFDIRCRESIIINVRIRISSKSIFDKAVTKNERIFGRTLILLIQTQFHLNGIDVILDGQSLLLHFDRNNLPAGPEIDLWSPVNEVGKHGVNDRLGEVRLDGMSPRRQDFIAKLCDLALIQLDVVRPALVLLFRVALRAFYHVQQFWFSSHASPPITQHNIALQSCCHPMIVFP